MKEDQLKQEEKERRDKRKKEMELEKSLEQVTMATYNF